MLTKWLGINRGGHQDEGISKHAAGRSRQDQHKIETNPQPAKLMQVIYPDPWVCVMHDRSIKRILNVGVPSCLPLYRRSSNHTQPYHVGATGRLPGSLGLFGCHDQCSHYVKRNDVENCDILLPMAIIEPGQASLPIQYWPF